MTIFTLFLSQHISAIQIDPLHIHSSLGEALYAEMNFQQADPRHTIEASIATEEDLKLFGIQHHPPAQLNIYIRQHHSGAAGVITLTSVHPITLPELDIVLKIKTGSDIKLQHIRQNLVRKNIPTFHHEHFSTPLLVDENQIALDLPTASNHHSKLTPQHQQTWNTGEKQLTFLSQSPPVLHHKTVPDTDTQLQNFSTLVPAADFAIASTSITHSTQTAKHLSPHTKAKQHHKATTKTVVRQYIVKKNQSLWQIASHLAAVEHRPIHQVMREIQQHNPYAFIDGDPSKLKYRARLNILQQRPAHPLKPGSHPSHRNQNTKHSTRSTKYRLNQAEMRLVSDHMQTAVHDQSQPKLHQFSAKVTESRKKAVELQNDVIQLEKSLQQKAAKIQLFNERLAQLQQQLERQKGKSRDHIK